MAAGIILTTSDINNAIGSVTRNLNVQFDQIGQLYTYFQAVGAAGLEAAPFNFSTGDAAVIMSAIADLQHLNQIYTGALSQNAIQGNNNAYDFRTFVKQLFGIGF